MGFLDKNWAGLNLYLAENWNGIKLKVKISCFWSFYEHDKVAKVDQDIRHQIKLKSREVERVNSSKLFVDQGIHDQIKLKRFYNVIMKKKKLELCYMLVVLRIDKIIE